MALFRRDSEPTGSASSPRSSPPTAEPQRRLTHVAPGSKVDGTVRGTTDVLVEGEIEGAVALESALLIGRGGLVRGGVVARTVEIAGRVVGDVRGLERVELTASGSLEGNVSAPRVIIAEGAFFKGKVEMTAPVAAPTTSPTTPAPPKTA